MQALCVTIRGWPHLTFDIVSYSFKDHPRSMTLPDWILTYSWPNLRFVRFLESWDRIGMWFIYPIDELLAHLDSFLCQSGVIDPVCPEAIFTVRVALFPSAMLYATVIQIHLTYLRNPEIGPNTCYQLQVLAEIQRLLMLGNTSLSFETGAPPPSPSPLVKGTKYGKGAKVNVHNIYEKKICLTTCNAVSKHLAQQCKLTFLSAAMVVYENATMTLWYIRTTTKILLWYKVWQA